MKAYTAEIMKNPNANGGYYSIHDGGKNVERLLFIEDDEGNSVKIRNEQIGELYRLIKPTLAG